ncbi:MAG: hypothetical protein ACRCX5_00445 [Bacteroidales bacterium]
MVSFDFALSNKIVCMQMKLFFSNKHIITDVTDTLIDEKACFTDEYDLSGVYSL